MASGSQALYSNTTGNSNTASGTQALYSNTSGSGGTASGDGALYHNTIGALNTASGSGAMSSNTTGSNNTASGAQALYSNATGSNNTASGTDALYFNTESFNTAVGSQALYSNNTGSNNIAIGYEAAFNVTSSNNIHIGNQGSASDSDTIRIGTTGTQTNTFIAGIQGVTTGLNDAVPVVIDNNGQLGTISSSRRYKEDIQDMGGASSGLMRLRPVTFRYKKPFHDGSQPMQYGLIAEEVAEVYPDLVARSADGQIQTVKYQVLDSMLLNELQKQKEYIRSLEERLAKLEAAIEGTTVTASSR
jgi:hypothetical protein